ncbi:DUF2488 family protein, partial [Nitriliruptoraceae bacterium ZYF776]|nr:DUF2488 family protein [Profundirhabdus halotolerans]
MSGMMKSVGASAVVNIPTAAATTTTTQLHHSAHCFPFLSFPQHLPKLTANCVSWRRTSSVRTSVAAANSSDIVEKETESKKTYHFVVANAKFMLDDEEHFQEQLFERARL